MSIIVTLSAIALALPNPVTGTASDDEAAIWQQVEARNQTWVVDDFDGHMALYHPGFRRWATTGGTLYDRDGFEALWDGIKAREKTASIAVVPEELQWLVPGKAAVAHYIIKEDVTVDGQPRIVRLRFSDIWVREGDRWLYAGGHKDGMAFERRQPQLQASD